MADSLFGHRHSDNIGSFRHLRIPQNIRLYAAYLHNGNSAKYFQHYAILQSINTPASIQNGTVTLITKATKTTARFG